MKKMELSLQVEQLGGGAEKTPGFRVKKWSVIPVKRRSVKRMMFDKIVESVSSIFQACFHHASSGASYALQPDNCTGSVTEEMVKMAPYRETKKTRIFPRKDYVGVVACQNDPSAN